MSTDHIPGGYLVQYGDDAQREVEQLPGDLQSRIQRKIRVASAVNPYTHGAPEGGIPDRLRMYEEGVSALVWVSSDVRVLTVAQVQTEEHDPEVSVPPSEFILDEDA